ncbi:hypothetical protein GCM10029992_39560 [Glycomyces albus]
MAWMLRVADVPSRVAIGLTKGRYDGEQWTISSNNFHAWVEVYFDGQGWVPFDPTPVRAWPARSTSPGTTSRTRTWTSPARAPTPHRRTERLGGSHRGPQRRAP